MIPWIAASDPDDSFPPADSALDVPNGLLAAGGDLSPGRLLMAYRAGIFPWFGAHDPIMWWSPDPRLVLHPRRVHCSRRLSRTLRQARFSFSIDRGFERVIKSCAELRAKQEGSWITPGMVRAYTVLHELGHAHSLEVWEQEQLVGGVYGLAIGRVFFGESMFHLRTDASKVALIWLCKLLAEHGFELLDCQVESEHLYRMGAETLPRARFLDAIERLCGQSNTIGDWQAPPLPVELARYFQQDGPYGQS